MNNHLSIPGKYVTQMREAAIFPIARLRTPGDGFYIPGADQSIKRYDEPGTYTVEEATTKFGKLIPTVGLVQWILDEAFKMQQLREKLNYFVPGGAFPDDEEMMHFLGLNGGGHLLRSDFLGLKKYLSTVALWWYTIRSIGSMSKDYKFKVRLLLP